ncbi:glycosyltransferase family 2 protein [Burkholderia anthina]|uniref:glycosyltransferase family 2 protein n=1 Tax=Burkholderia anthina TaxID=179879 RepID=UPI00158DF253|nr:glycosyltransferase family 2 protein [Burkholderia anthina]MBY4871182.1 glycosyltransferase family 2 protein [Burkholderia anthina]
MGIKLCVAAIVKNEADSLLEWIAFHRSVGVQKFFIADNESTDTTPAILEALSRESVVEYFSIATPFDGNAQMAAYSEIIKIAKGKCDVLAFIDADEYLVSTDNCHSILPLIEEFFSDPTVGALGLNWANFGSSGRLFLSEGLVIERFTRRAPQNFNVNLHIKSIIRPEMASGFGNPHYALLKEGRYIDTTGTEIVANERHGSGLTNKVIWHRARVNHYATKSLEEFVLGKSRRGSASKINRIKHEKYFMQHDRNDEECLLAAGMAGATKKEIRELERLLQLGSSEAQSGTSAIDDKFKNIISKIKKLI